MSLPWQVGQPQIKKNWIEEQFDKSDKIAQPLTWMLNELRATSIILVSCVINTLWICQGWFNLHSFIIVKGVEDISTVNGSYLKTNNYNWSERFQFSVHTLHRREESEMLRTSIDATVTISQLSFGAARPVWGMHLVQLRSHTYLGLFKTRPLNFNLSTDPILSGGGLRPSLRKPQSGRVWRQMHVGKILTWHFAHCLG